MRGGTGIRGSHLEGPAPVCYGLCVAMGKGTPTTTQLLGGIWRGRSIVLSANETHALQLGIARRGGRLRNLRKNHDGQNLQEKQQAEKRNQGAVQGVLVPGKRGGGDLKGPHKPFQ